MSERVLIVHDPVSPDAREDEVDTLQQVAQIDEALRTAGMVVSTAVFVDDPEYLTDLIRTFAPTLLFNMVETLDGSRGLYRSVRALCSFGIPITGCGSKALQITSDKLWTKRLLRQACLPTPDWAMDAEGLSRCHLARVIIKPVSEDGSVGIDESSVCPVSQAISLLETGRDVFAEEYIDGEELNLSLLQLPDRRVVLLPPARMVFVDYPLGRPKVLGYAAKWDPESFAYSHSLRSFDQAAAWQEKLEPMSHEIWDLFELNGYARIDLRIDEQGNPFVLEINANPAISRDSGFVAAAAQAGISYEELIRIITLSAVRYEDVQV